MRDDENYSNENTSNLLSEYIVEERDTIPEIERKLGISWSEIQQANAETISNSDILRSGIKLKIPNKRT